MKDEELLAANYLRHRGFSDIAFEPDGKVTPDFVVDGRIAIEVRRLNQNFQLDDCSEGLEQARRRLFRKIGKLVKSIDSDSHQRSWFVNFTFRRPVEAWQSLEPKLKETLVNFLKMGSSHLDGVDLGNGFELELFPASSRHETVFLMGAHMDDDSGGWLTKELTKNIDLCMREKTEKRKHARREYLEWWLILVDHIGYGMIDSNDLRRLRQDVQLPTAWQKVIIVNPNNHTHAVEI